MIIVEKRNVVHVDACIILLCEQIFRLHSIIIWLLSAKAEELIAGKLSPYTAWPEFYKLREIVIPHKTFATLSCDTLRGFRQIT